MTKPVYTAAMFVQRGDVKKGQGNLFNVIATILEDGRTRQEFKFISIDYQAVNYLEMFLHSIGTGCAKVDVERFDNEERQ